MQISKDMLIGELIQMDELLSLIHIWPVFM